MPVPWSSSPLPFTSMLTIEGRTRCTSLGMLTPLGKMAAPGAVPDALIVSPPSFDELGAAKCPASPPTRAATSKSERRVDQRPLLCRDCEASGASSTTGVLEVPRAVLSGNAAAPALVGSPS